MSLMETRKEAVEPWESEGGEKDPQVEKIREQGRRDGGVRRLRLELDNLGPGSLSATVQLHNLP